MSNYKTQDYAIITKDDRMLYLSKIFGLNEDGEYVVDSTDYEHNATFQEHQATDGGFELGNRRYGTREMTFSGYVVHKEAYLKEIIALCHRIEYLQSPRGGIARAQIASTNISWLEGNYLGIGEFELVIRLLDPFFLGKIFMPDVQLNPQFDRMMFEYPAVSEYNQIDYIMRIIIQNTVKRIPRYSNLPVVNDQNFFLEPGKEPDVPDFDGTLEEPRRRVVAFLDPPRRPAIIKRIVINNGPQYGEIDGSLDAPSLLGSTYDTIVIDTKEQSIRGQYQNDQPENLFRHRLRGSSFNGILPNQRLRVTVIGESLELVKVVLRLYDKEVF